MTIPELLDQIYREAWREAGGHIPTIAKRLGVSRSGVCARATALGLLEDRKPYIRKPIPEAEAVALVRERLTAGPVPYFGSRAQQALIVAGEARIVGDGPYQMLEAVQP